MTNGNEAVNLAAEQSKETADKNLPAFGDLPIPDDTANLRQGPNLHDGLLALLPLVGVWRGQGQANPPGTEEDITFGQQVVFSHDGENRLAYESRTWRMDDDGQPAGPARRETGWWTIDDDDNIEVIIAHSDGVAEIMYGKPMNERAWELQSNHVVATQNGRTDVQAGKRLYGLMPNNNLGWVDERVYDGEMAPWMSAELRRVMG